MARIARIGLYRQQFNGQATRIEWVSIERALAIVKLTRIRIEIRIINVKIMKLIRIRIEIRISNVKIMKLIRIRIEIRISNVKIMKLISRRPSLVEPAAVADPAAQLTLPENSH